MAPAAGVLDCFMLQPQSLVRETQSPGAKRNENAGVSFGILIKNIDEVVMPLGIVEVEQRTAVLSSHCELA
jgi:hypothetical protein